MTIQKLPNLGDGVQEVTLSRWIKKSGDAVALNEPLLEVETDKISLEVTAESAGVLTSQLAREGSKLRVGDPLAEIGEAAEKTIPNTQYPIPNPAPAASQQSRVSPVVSRMAAEHGLTLGAISGTGEGGRVTKQDVLAFLKTRDDKVAKEQSAEATHNAQYQTPNPIAQQLADSDQLLPLSAMRARIAEHMTRSVQTSPHVTTIFEFDFGAVAKHRETRKDDFARDGANLTYLAYLAVATAQALQAHPLANSVWTDKGIILKREINIGIAVAIPPDGLLVPVIHHADELSLMGMARKIQDLAARARAKQIKPDETQGGTFSITNHGVGGSLAGTPIINQPQAGILGFGALEKRVKVVNDMIAIRPCAYISFSFDHRILDGAAADAFVMAIKQKCENWS